MTNHERIKSAFADIKAPDNITGSILKNAGGSSVRTPRQTRFIVRTVIVVAVVVALTITAIAVPAALWQIGNMSWDNDRNQSSAAASAHPISITLREYIDFNVWVPLREDSPDTVFWVTEDYMLFEQAFFEDTMEYTEAMAKYLPRFTLDEAAEFFGVTFAKNPLVPEWANEQRAASIWYKPNTGDVLVTLFALDYYSYNDKTISIDYSFRLTYNEGSGNVSFGVHYLSSPDDDGSDLDVDFEYYTSPVNGIEALLLNPFDNLFEGNPGLTPYSVFVAQFSLNNIFYDISGDFSFDILKEIIDAFE